ncbi:purine-nucleoside phosphorylase [Pseudokineococcus lusitanus]|uniref:Purine nucleoside phosphorylase n=1 Tax=Pseudokineococcus lusitanus TaxID=763993 RepID=A0A3N1HM64_9ACTN|nr:purine-nucleoside phosphorylase [Pseudokineococcus lusitanus]ROP43633.1 purine-nucleoside phosphorylase [Pseudokineococcus lusitanus]
MASPGAPSPDHRPDDAAEALADPTAAAAEAAAVLARRTGVERHDLALVLGSGWGTAVDSLGEVVAEVPADEVPGFTAPAVAGHVPVFRSVRIGSSDRVALVLGSRTHLYEGRGVRAVAHGVRTAAAAGCRGVVLTNGCGGLDSGYAPGQPVLIADHLNLTGRSPLEGAIFVDLTDLYSRRWRDVAREVDPTLAEGVYAQFPGPHYETPAEVRMAGVLGATLVGMSTTLEAIAARAAGLEVLGISLVTNLAAGISPHALSHEEVVQAGRDAGPRIGALLAEVVGRL